MRRNRRVQSTSQPQRYYDQWQQANLGLHRTDEVSLARPGNRSPSPERRSDHSWVEPAPESAASQAASPMSLRPCSRAESLHYEPRSAAPSPPPRPPSICRGEEAVLEELLVGWPEDMPEAEEAHPAGYGTPKLECEKVEEILAEPAPAPRIHVDARATNPVMSREQTCFRHYRSLTAALDILPTIDRSRVQDALPEILVLNLGGNSAQVVGALTGVDLRVDEVVPNPLVWEVTLRAQESLYHIENAFPAPNQTAAIRLVTHRDRSADLIVHDLAGDSLLHSVKGVLDEKSCAIVVVRAGKERWPLPPAVVDSDPVGARTILLETFDKSGNWKVELSQKLDGILTGILRTKISETMNRLKSRIDEVRAELNVLPAKHSDATAKLMSLATEFAGDVFGISSKSDGATGFAESILSEYAVLSRELRKTMPQFSVRRPITPPAPWFQADHTVHAGLPVETPIMSRAVSPCRSVAASQISVAWPRGPTVRASSVEPATPPRQSIPDEALLYPRSRPHPSNISPVLPSGKDITSDTVISCLQLSRTGELPGHFPLEKVSRAIIAEGTELWADIAVRQLQSIVQLLAGRLSMRVEEIYGKYAHSGIRAKLLDIIKERIRSVHCAARDAIGILARMEGSAFVGNEQLFLAAKERWSEQFSREQSLPVGLLRIDRLRHTAALDVMATVAAYFEIAHQRFVDGVERAIESHVIRSLGKDLAPEILRALKHKEAKTWLEVPKEIAAKRVELEDRLEALRRAREEVMLCALA